MKSHYDTLGVNQHATKKEIKSAFRKLSMETHPDVAADTSNVERFKQIAEAHRVLSNENERRIYDAEMMDPIRSELRKHGRGFGRHAAAAQGAAEVQHPSLMHAFFDGMGRPRNIALGLTIGIGAMMTLQYTFGNEKRITNKPVMVEAWFNPSTQQFEPPAPWDPTYKKLKPTLQFVPREDVRQHHSR